ncbi:MAG: D-alanine--D-alanine ligase [Deltaproteobacteria bacterium]|jgi:D-alanine-D-alanine ligase|nr:D-alanine--D-alanine ligase [Deltaproteobacteria bacterium]
MRRLRVALVFGGNSTEREVSLASGQEVARALSPDLYEVSRYDPPRDLARLIADAPSLDVAFPLLHGRGGEDGSIQGFLNLLGLPYVGSGVLASAQCMDKRATKNIYRQSGLPVAPDALLSQKELSPQEALEIAAREIGFPLALKPVDQGSSVGLSILFGPEEWPGALQRAWDASPLALAEKYLAGREFSVPVLESAAGATSLPPIEIVPAPGRVFFDYAAKYEPGESREICPAPLAPDETAAIGELAIRAHLALGCRGLSRTDFILTEEGFRLLETNTLPGFTAGSLYPLSARAYGLSLPELLGKLFAFALEAPPDFSSAPARA